VSGAIGAAAADWKRDLEVVVTGRDRAQAESDPTLSRYRVDRAVTRLAQPLARVLASVARGGPDAQAGDVPGASPEDLAPLVRAVVRTFAAAGGKPDALVALTRCAVTSLVEHLLDLAVAPPEGGRAAGRVVELEAIGRSLGGREPSVAVD
jgi:hypothetical protein